MSRAADVHLYYQPTIASPHSHPQYRTITYCYWWAAVCAPQALRCTNAACANARQHVGRRDECVSCNRSCAGPLACLGYLSPRSGCQLVLLRTGACIGEARGSEGGGRCRQRP